MKRLVLGAALLAVSCGGTKQEPSAAPDLITRPTGNNGRVEPLPSDEFSGDYLDGGGVDPDGGMVGDAGSCCTIPFAVTALPGEVAAQLDIAGTSFEMALVGGHWEVNACIELASWDYFFETFYRADDDAGTLSLVRWNEAVPISYTSSLGPTVNTFVTPNDAVCSTFDASLYSQLDVPDAGLTDSGTADAGTIQDAGTQDAGAPPDVDAGPDPVKTLITGACDSLDVPTVLLTQPSSGLLDEEIAAAAALPFAFRYYGTNVTHFAAAANGYVQLLTSAATPTQSFWSAAIPNVDSPNGMIAPFWDDLVGVTGTVLQTQTFGMGAARHLTLEWSNWSFFYGTGDERITFQVKLFETTNAIEVHYCSLNANGGTAEFEQGFGASTGIESPTGAKGIQHSYHTSSLTTSTALHFE